jgi:hypothetical protein
MAAIEMLARLLGLEKKMILSSSLKVTGRKSDLVLGICQQVGASAYYSGRAGSTYLDRDAFQRAGIEIVVQNFNHPTYPQLFMKTQGFVPNLSILDLLFNCGAKSLELIGAEDTLAAAGISK